MMLSKNTLIEMVVDQLEKEAHRLEITPSMEWVTEQAKKFCANFNLGEIEESTVINLLRTKVEVSVAYFGPFRTVISGLSEHPFRFNPNAHSAIIRTLLS